MSFAEKITNLMARPNQQPGPTDDQPWYLKYGVRLLGIAGGFFCIVFGLFTTLNIVILDVWCVLGGIIQVVIGFLVLALEAPCCFFCIDYVGQMADMVDGRPMWYRAAAYCGLVIIPLSMCFGFANLFACALVFGTGVIYGMMSLGKKASADDMRQAAVNSGLAGMPQGSTTNDRAGIINNAQPFSFTGAVGTDSNV